MRPVRDGAAERRTPIRVTRLYAGPDGQAHAAKTEVIVKPSASSAGVEESETIKVSGAQFLRCLPDQEWGWHTAPRRQYVVTLSGRGEVELAEGQKIPLNPGEVVLAEDVTGKGHITRSLGPEDLVLLFVPLADQQGR